VELGADDADGGKRYGGFRGAVLSRSTTPGDVVVVVDDERARQSSPVNNTRECFVHVALALAASNNLDETIKSRARQSRNTMNSFPSGTYRSVLIL